MKQKNHTYFETKPQGGFLDSETYEKSSTIMGRMCLDVALITNNSLVLVDRSVEPMKGPWLAGGRIKWEKFNSVYQYASETVLEQFGIASKEKSMTLLEPRFVCFKKRAYPEILIWIVVKISNTEYKKIALSSTEQAALIPFDSKKKLQSYVRKAKLSAVHQQLLLQLFDEIRERKLLI